MKNNNPKVSIVIPSFNQGKYIESTILSIIRQSYLNLELIVIDGGSSDNTTEILKKYNDKIKYWVSESDDGQSDAINKGFNIATGNIFAWLNSDDIYSNETIISKVVKQFVNNDADVVYGNMLVMDQNEKIIAKRYLTRFLPKPIRSSYFCGGFGIYQPSSFWTAELYKNVGGINTQFRFCMDNELFNKFVVTQAKFVYLNEFIASFRVHEFSKTSNLFDIANQERAFLYKHYVIDNKIAYPSLFDLLAKMFKIIMLAINFHLFAVIKYRLFNKYKWVP